MNETHYKGDLPYKTHLPQHAEVGDVYFIIKDHHFYIYENKKWQILNENRRYE